MVFGALPRLPWRRTGAFYSRYIGSLPRRGARQASQETAGGWKPSTGQRIVLNAATACVLTAGLLQASAVDENAPTDEQVTAAVLATERLLNQNRSAEALSIIRPVAEARPDSEQATFSMGLAALASADAGAVRAAGRKSDEVKDNYNLAVRSFRGMLVKDPSRMRVRLELGRALFSRGNCTAPPKNLVKHLLGDDCWAAEQHFLRVIGQDIPPQVIFNVRQFIRICRARKRAQGSLTLALAPDTNVNTSTSAQTVSIFGLPFQLDEDARARSGIGVVGTISGEVQRPLRWMKFVPGSTALLRMGGSIYRRDYSGGNFDDSNYGLYVGPRFVSRTGQFSVLMQADQRAVNGQPYSRQWGLRLEGLRLITQRIAVGGTTEASMQQALGLEGPIGKPGLSWNGVGWLNYSLLPSLGIRFMGGTGRENTDRVTTRHLNRWAGIAVNYDLPLGFTVSAAQQFYQTTFDQPNTIFSPDPPSTDHWFSRIAIHNRLIQYMGFSPSISIIREDRDSNLTLYTYKRFRVEGGVVRVF